MRGVSARVALIVVVALGVLPSAASADFGIAPGSFEVSMLDGAGAPEQRAAAHPDVLRMSFAFNSIGDEPDGNVKDIEFELPAGLVGDPRAIPTCPRAGFTIVDSVPDCPPGSQLGIVTLDQTDFASTLQIFNIDPAADALAAFGFKNILFSGRLFARVREDGEGFTISMSRVIQDFPLLSADMELWGVPADHRFESAEPRRPFLTMPTGCDGGPPTATMRANSWQEPDVWRSATTAAGGTPVGCDTLPFDPRLELALDSRSTDTPTGADVRLALPQNDDPDERATARIREVRMSLPEGMALSPSAANGLTACPDEAVGLGTGTAPTCPRSSKLGTAEIASPLLREPLTGSLHLGRQLSDLTYRLFVVASRPGIDVKIGGTLLVDPDSGRLTTVLTGLPQVPFDRVELRFDGGPQAPLATPLTCGTRVAAATFDPHGGGPERSSSTPVAIDRDPSGAPCPARAPFAPKVVAGSARARAGVSSAFSVELRRRDGEQLLDRFSTALPLGLTANLASVERCGAVPAAAGACPRASRVGSVAVEVGSGPRPFALEGDVFLTGPYRRAPFGFALVLPARVGPFDLGTVVSRAALRFDSRTGRVTVDADPLPAVVKGIPLRMQTVMLDIDRPGFMVNPTSCVPTKIASVVRSQDEAVSRSAVRFAVGGCRFLRFGPKVSLALTDRSELGKGDHPGLKLRIASPRGGANIRVAKVRLPKIVGLDPSGVTALCSREQARDGECPDGAHVGTARGSTRLLSRPLKGDVYLVQPKGNGLPDLWAQVGGMGVSMSLRMEISVRDGQIVTKLVDLPDFPLSSFTVRFPAGKQGILTTTRSPCVGRRPRRIVVPAALTAHSDVHRRLRTRLRVPGCGSR